MSVKVAWPRVAVLAAGLLVAAGLEAGDARRADAVRVQENIRVDGVLDEAVWQQAPTIGDFVQSEPNPGQPPSEQTEVRVAYTDSALFIAVYSKDSEPGRILATEMARDGALYNDDNIQILIDTFDDGRNAYYFQTNPLGALVDGRITENRTEDINWDGIWMVRSRIVDDGWIAEFEIPFKTLAFQANGSTWGFNIERYIGRSRESSRWASPSLDVRFNQVAMAGAIGNLEGMSQGVGLDVKPFGLVGYARDIDAEDRHEFLRDGGADIFYRITTNLTSSTTFNTDFAETEADTRQVNLTRFSLFFPEKRAFFLEDAGVFDFGITNSSRSRGSGGGRGGSGRGNSLVPFFSRTIGLTGGEPVPIRVGEKLTGKIGRFDIGILNVLTGETELPTRDGVRTLSRQNLFVARSKMNFFSQSYVGALVTNGEPSGESDNTLLGLDLNLSTADFLGSGKSLGFTTFGSKTWTPDIDGQDLAYGSQISYPNDLVTASLTWQHIGENYNPALGYAQRKGVRQTGVRSSLRPRPDWPNVRQLTFQLSFDHYHSLIEHATESKRLRIVPFEVEFNSGQRIEYQVARSFENLFEPFEISDGVELPTGEYSYTTHRIAYNSPTNRALQFTAGYELGNFYSGTSDQLDATVSWSNSHISTSAQLNQYWVDLPEGDFTTSLLVTRFDYSFTPLITLANFVQYDTESDNIGLQSRLRWIVRPGNEIFLVLNHSWEDNPLEDRFISTTTDARFKINYTFRF